MRFVDAILFRATLNLDATLAELHSVPQIYESGGVGGVQEDQDDRLRLLWCTVVLPEKTPCMQPSVVG